MARPLAKEYLTWKGLLLIGLILFSMASGLVITFGPDHIALILTGLVAAVVAVFIILSRPFGGLLIYSIFVFIRPQEFIPGLDMSIERPIAIIFIVSVVLLLKLKRNMRVRLSSIDYGLLLFVAIAFMSIFTSIWVTQSLETWQKLFRLLIIHFLISLTIETRQQLRIYILFIILSAAFHASGSVINYYRGITEFSMGIDRAVGLGGAQSLFGQSNALAGTMVCVLPYIYYMFLGDKSRVTRVLMVAVTPILLWNIILTGSRGGMLGVAILAILIMWNSRRRYSGLAVVIVFFITAWAVMPDQYRERLESSTDFTSGTGAAVSAKSRIEGLTKGMRMVVDRPILGYGIGNYKTASATVYGGGWRQAHNLLGQILGELGFLGLAAFIIWMTILFRSLARIRKFFKETGDKLLYYTALGLNIQLLVLLFFGLGGHNLYRSNWIIIGSLTVVMLSFISREKAGEKEPGRQISTQDTDYPTIKVR